MALSKKLVLTAGVALVSGGALMLALRGPADGGSSHARSASPSSAAGSSDAPQGHASPALAASVSNARALVELAARRDGLVAALTDAAEREPAAAIRIAMTLTPAEGRDEALRESIGHYLSVDPEGARAWLGEVLAREDAELSVVVVSAAGRYDAKLGAELAGMVHENRRGPMLQELFANWAGSDPAAASAAALERGNPKDLLAAGVGTVSTWAQTEPQAAWTWASALEPDGVRRPVLESLVSTWSEHDPAAAARASLGAHSSSRQRLLDTAFSAWAARDIDAAFDWLETVSDAEARDGAATAALLALSETEPARAAERAAAWERETGASDAVLDKVLTAFNAHAPEEYAQWQRARARR